MGNCCATTKLKDIDKVIILKIREAIEKNSTDKLRQIIIKHVVSSNKELDFNINQPIIKLYQCDMNALGYALFKGNTEAFAVILELGKAKISAMSNFYAILAKRPIDVICELGHKQLLEFYLPFYLNKNDEIEESEEDSLNLSISRSKITKSHINEKSKSILPLSAISPLHRACDKGMLNIISFCWEHFQNKITPKEFDIHYQDEITGENCALISCKTGNIEIIKYLHETCKANFHIFNKRKENAIQILAVWSKKRKERRFKECFKYLIEVVGVDYTYEVEETLLVLEEKSIIMYLEEKLKIDNISINKSRVDDKYSLSKNRAPIVMDPALEMKLNKIKGTKFDFTMIFKEELEESKADISSIYQKSVQSISNITFMEENI